jgi:UDPglucose 6-dehydrogenase
VWKTADAGGAGRRVASMGSILETGIGLVSMYSAGFGENSDCAEAGAGRQLTFVGMGYLGATYAICFAHLGYDVLGMDIDPRKVALLSSGIVPFFEPGLQELLRANLASGRLRFTDSYDDVVSFGEIHFVCVGTPQQNNGFGADLSFLTAAVSALASRLDRNALIVGKSTVPVGTAAKMQRIVAELSRSKSEIEIAWCPEFLQEGNAVEDVLRPGRLVFGVASEVAEKLLLSVHARVLDLAADERRDLPVIVTDLETAVLAKLASNAFLATKISFVNAMASMCDRSGANVVTLARILGCDPRIGGRFLDAGVGFGGGCLPKDIRSLQTCARQFGIGESFELLAEVDRINEACRRQAVERLACMVGRAGKRAIADMGGVRVAVLGVAFKPNSDDIRESPGLSIVRKLIRAGATVSIYDPMGLEAAARVVAPKVEVASSVEQAVVDADVLCLLTEWDELRNMDPEVTGTLVRSRRIFDGRNCLDGERWREAGWLYQGIGLGRFCSDSSAVVQKIGAQRRALSGALA